MFVLRVLYESLRPGPGHYTVQLYVKQPQHNLVESLYNLLKQSLHVSRLLYIVLFVCAGQVRGFNRNALVDTSTSVVQRMSFETAGRFLRAGVQSGQSETLRNASARLVAGRPPLNGTGAFDLLVSLK